MGETIESLNLSSAFMRVDLPALGAPRIAAKPALKGGVIEGRIIAN